MSKSLARLLLVTTFLVAPATARAQSDSGAAAAPGTAAQSVPQPGPDSSAPDVTVTGQPGAEPAEPAEEAPPEISIPGAAQEIVEHLRRPRPR